jgi:site-specific recombinase XerD
MFSAILTHTAGFPSRIGVRFLIERESRDQENKMPQNTAAAIVADPLLDQWGAALADADRSTNTCRRYLPAVRQFLIWYEVQNHEPFLPERLTPIDLAGYRAYLQQQRATSTANVAIAALRAFCAWLVDTGRLTANPAARLKVVGRQAPLAPKALKPMQVNALLREAQTTRYPERDTATLQLLVQTGIRIGECAALRLGDILVSERQGQVTVRAGKGNKSRVVPLNASARQALANYLAPLWGVEPTMKAVGAAWPHDAGPAPLWRSQKGGALGKRALTSIVEALVASCAARELVPVDTSAHTLRHTFATNYLKDHPGDLVGLAALLGHTTLETTRIYVQPSHDELAYRVEQTRLNAYG